MPSGRYDVVVAGGGTAGIAAAVAAARAAAPTLLLHPNPFLRANATPAIVATTL
jgi:succinate dehydrogenase/fumarate reductase flavoprotein subunit